MAHNLSLWLLIISTVLWIWVVIRIVKISKGRLEETKLLNDLLTDIKSVKKAIQKLKNK